jgi:hypothetical protein
MFTALTVQVSSAGGRGFSANFMDNFSAILWNMLPEQAKAKPIEIWFQDEARIGQKGSLTRLWAPKGTRPRAVRDTRYQWAYLFGAVCPARKLGAGLVMPYANTEAMNKHLEEIAKVVSPGAHAALLLDQAGWHGSQDLIVPENITLIPFPPYSPELNPAENVWEYLRKNKLSNRLYQTYEDIVEACCEAWNYLMGAPEVIVSPLEAGQKCHEF